MLQQKEKQKTKTNYAIVRNVHKYVCIAINYCKSSQKLANINQSKRYSKTTKPLQHKQSRYN